MSWWVHEAEQFDAEPTGLSSVHATPSSQLLGHEPAPDAMPLSQVSPLSTTPLPQPGGQSESLLALQPEAQHPSPSLQVVIRWFEHSAVHSEALPVSVSMVQTSLSLHAAGQAPAPAVMVLSQVSPLSTTPLPQTGEQSASLLALQPGAQHPSPPRQLVMGRLEQMAVHRVALPTSVSMVQASLSLHEVGHAPVPEERALSQVSPASKMALPQTGRQSESLLALQPGAQHPSPPRQAVMRRLEQLAVHRAARPDNVSFVQASLSSHEVGQAPRPEPMPLSQVSLGSTTPLPQTGWQSESLLALQPEAQHPSPLLQAVIR